MALDLEEMGIYYSDTDCAIKYYCPLCRSYEFGFVEELNEEELNEDFKNYESNRFSIVDNKTLQIIKKAPIEFRSDLVDKREIAYRYMECQEAKKILYFKKTAKYL